MIAKKGRTTHFGLLEESDHWSDEYFDLRNAKNHRREMFFANPAVAWTKKAPQDPDVFAGEGTRAPARVEALGHKYLRSGATQETQNHKQNGARNEEHEGEATL